MTVTGPISADQLGFTLIHEHIYLDLLRDAWLTPNYLDDPELAHIELQRYKDAGGVTIVDQTSGGLRESDHDLLFDQDLNHLKHADAVKQVAIDTGINIILGCGWYRETYYEPRLWRMKTDEIAEEMVRDVTVGIDGTDVRAGFIGEIGAHFNSVSAIEERVLRAAARAQIKTGVALGTHATRGPQGLQQLDVLMQEGVDPRRVVIAHSGSYPRHKYHAEIAKRGAYISFDRMGNLKTANPFDFKRSLRLIKEIIDAGLIRNLLFSHDVCYKTDYVTYGGGGYDFLSTQGLTVLNKEIGLTEEQFKTIMYDNPRRLLTGEGA
jgi:phosphotriesterase-related protein